MSLLFFSPFRCGERKRQDDGFYFHLRGVYFQHLHPTPTPSIPIPPPIKTAGRSDAAVCSGWFLPDPWPTAKAEEGGAGGRLTPWWLEGGGCEILPVPVRLASRHIPSLCYGTARSVTQGGRRVRHPPRTFTIKTQSATAALSRVVSGQLKLLLWKEPPVFPVLFRVLYGSWTT